eukprot:3938596-Rhodomonas_salina.3
MLVHGTANPQGEEDGYVGMYLSQSDIRNIVHTNELVGKPVLLEHGGDCVGKVISAWEFNGKLDILVDLPSDQLNSRLAGSFVASNCVRDFSLGYKVQMSSKRDDVATIGKKHIVEVSLVRKGARNDCHIKNFQR